ncbi:GIDE domain-containing protein [Candidatus Neomarinimicrobiota bacterium]
MGENINILVPISGFIVGVVLFIAGLKWFGYKRLIENIPTSKIRSIAMGLVEIFGRVVPIEKNVLNSPFSNTECVYYKYTVERWVKRNDRHYWQVVNSGKTSLPFILKDNTGSVLINPIGADIDIKSITFSSGVGQDPPLIIQNFLNSNNLNYEGFFGINYRMRYRESIIVPGESLFIIGSALDNPFKDDGTAQHSVEDIMIHRGKGKLFHISQKAETGVIKTYLMKALGGLIVGSLLIIICFNILLKMFETF